MQIQDIRRGLCFTRVTKTRRLTCNLVIAVSDFNVTYMAVDKFIKYEFIDGLKLTGEIWNGMSVCIDNMRGSPITTFIKEVNSSSIIPIGYLSQKQMVKIIAAVTDYLNGNLIFSNSMIKHKFEIDDKDILFDKTTKNEDGKSHIYNNDRNSVSSNDYHDYDVVTTTYNSNNNGIDPIPQVENVEVPQNDTNNFEEHQAEEDTPIDEETHDKNSVVEDDPSVEESSKEEESVQVVEETPKKDYTPIEMTPIVESTNKNLEVDDGDKVSAIMIIEDKESKSPIEAISEYIPVEINPTTGEKWYDLTVDYNNKIEVPKKRRDYPAKKNKKNNSESSEVDLFRHFYSESEVRIIALSSTKSVMSKYKVTNDVAYMLCKNARKIMNIDQVRRPKENNFVDFFNEGYTPEELIEVFGEDMRIRITASYKSYSLNKNAVLSRNDIKNKYKDITDNGRDNIAFIDQVFKMKNIDISRMEKCSIKNANYIKFIVEEYLMSRYIQYYIGCDYTTTADTFKDDPAALAVFNKAIQLKDAVIRSYRYHVDIANGVKPIPSSVPEEDKEFYMAIIINRVVGSHSRTNKILTDTQRNIISNLDNKNRCSREMKMMAFMSVDNERIRGRIYRMRMATKNNKESTTIIDSSTPVNSTLAATV